MADDEKETLHDIISREQITKDISQYDQNELDIYHAAMELSTFRHSYVVTSEIYESQIYQAANILVQLKNSQLKKEMIENNWITLFDDAISCGAGGAVSGEKRNTGNEGVERNVYNMRNISIYLALLILSAVAFYVSDRRAGIFTRITTLFGDAIDNVVNISSTESFRKIVEQLNNVLNASTNRFMTELSQITSELILYISGRGQNLPQLNALSLYTWLAVCGKAWNDLKKILVPVMKAGATTTQTAASYLYKEGKGSIKYHLKLIDDIFQKPDEEQPDEEQPDEEQPDEEQPDAERRKIRRKAPATAAPAAAAAAASSQQSAASSQQQQPAASSQQQPAAAATGEDPMQEAGKGGRRTRRRRKKSRKQKRRRGKGSKWRGSRPRRKRKSHYRRAQ